MQEISWDDKKITIEMVRHFMDSHKLERVRNTDFADLCADLDRALLQTCTAVI